MSSRCPDSAEPSKSKELIYGFSGGNRVQIVGEGVASRQLRELNENGQLQDDVKCGGIGQWRATNPGGCQMGH
jgi:hypothetical protein